MAGLTEQIERAGQPPALAYRAMVARLPAYYLTEPPPEQGIELVVTGSDRVRTFWRMNRDLASAITPFMIRAGMVVGTRAYLPPPEEKS